MSLVAVTGGLGYVGGRLSSALLDAGLDVRVLSRSSPPAGITDVRIRKACVQTDYGAEGLASALRDVDTVVHLAAMNEVDCAVDPIEATRVNTIGTQRVLASAIKAKVKRFVFFSTAHVYGAPLAGRITEDCATSPAHPYSITHKAAEDFVLAAHRRGDLQGRILRLSNSFGPPLNPEVNRWTLVCNDLCRQAAELGRISLKTSGIQLRDFIPLTDVCNAVVFLERNSDVCPEAVVLNLGGRNALSIRTIAEDVRSLFAEIYQLEIGFNAPDPKPQETAAALDFDISRFESMGYSLKGSYRDEMASLVQRCREWFGNRS